MPIKLLILASVLLPRMVFADPPAMVKACEEKGAYLFDLGGARQCLNRDEHAVLCKLRGYTQEQCFEIFDAQISGKKIKLPNPKNPPVTREERMKQFPDAAWVKTDKLGTIRGDNVTCPADRQYIPRPGTKKGYICVKRGSYYKQVGTAYFATSKCEHGAAMKTLSANPKVNLPVCLAAAGKSQEVPTTGPAPAPLPEQPVKPAKTDSPNPAGKQPAWQEYLKKSGKTLTGSKNSKQTGY